MSAGTLQLHICPSLTYKFNPKIQICHLVHLFSSVIFLSGFAVIFIITALVGQRDVCVFSYLAWMVQMKGSQDLSPSLMQEERSGLNQNWPDLLHLSAFLKPWLPGKRCDCKEELFSLLWGGHSVRSGFPKENWNSWEDWRATETAATTVA